MAKARVYNWSSDVDGSDLLSYDGEKQMFNVKCGRVKPAVLRELITAATDALKEHDAATRPQVAEGAQGAV